MISQAGKMWSDASNDCQTAPRLEQPLTDSCSPTQQCIHDFLHFHGDAMLCFVLLEPEVSSTKRSSNPRSTNDQQSADLPITNVDRHFILWLLREILITSLTTNDLLSESSLHILRWLVWLLANPISKLGVTNISENANIRSALLKSRTGVPTRKDWAFPPFNAPGISLATRHLLIQEFRLLLDNGDRFVSHSLTMANLTNCGCILESIEKELKFVNRMSSDDFKSHQRGYLQKSWRKINDATDFGSSRLNQFSNDVSHSLQSILVQSPSFRLPFRVVNQSRIVKAALLQTEILPTLLELVFGSSSFLNLKNMVTANAQVGQNTDAFISEIEVEVWWCSASLLWQILRECEEAKMRIDDEWLGLIHDFLLQLALLIGNYQRLSQQDSTLSWILQLLSGMAVELCLSHGSWSAPSSPFFAFCFNFPNDVKAAHSEMIQSSDVMISSTFEYKSLDVIFAAAIRNLKKSQEIEDGEESTYREDMESLTRISPLYYVKERTAAQIVSCLNSFPVALEFVGLSKPLIATSSAQSVTSIQKSTQGCTNGPISRSSNDWVGGNCLTETALRQRTRKRSNSLRSRTSNNSLFNLADLNTAVSETWEQESVGKASIHSTVYSHNSSSVVLITQALRSIAVSNPSPSPSINGDAASSVSLARNTLPFSRENSFDTSYYNFSNQFKTSLLESSMLSAQYDDDVNQAMQYPYLYYPVLSYVSPSMREKLLLVLHDTLLYKSDLSVSDLQDFECDSCFHTDKPFETFSNEGDCCPINKDDKKSTMSKHLIASRFRKQFLTFFTSKIDPWKFELSNFSHRNVWRPNYSTLKIRNVKCGAHLLSLALILEGEAQNIVLSLLSRFLDSNPACSFLFATSTVSLYLAKVIHVLSERLATTFSYILSQILCRFACPRTLLEVIRVANSSSIQYDELELNGSDTDESKTKEISVNVLESRNEITSQMLVILGRVARENAPSMYFHFNQASPLETGIVYPNLLTLPSSNTGFTISGWIRIGSFSNTAITSLCQVSTCREDHQNFGLMDIFFRIVHKTSQSQHRDNDTESVSIQHRETTAGSEELMPRSLQLCISFGNAVVKGSDVCTNVTAIASPLRQEQYFNASDLRSGIQSSWCSILEETLQSYNALTSREREECVSVQSDEVDDGGIDPNLVGYT
jgi:hypothetical protein